MPPQLRAQVDVTRVVTIRNYWEFSAPPIPAEVLNAVGDAVAVATVFGSMSSDQTEPDPTLETSTSPSQCAPNRTNSCSGPVVDTSWPTPLT